MGGLAVEDENCHLHTVAQKNGHRYEIDDTTLPSEEQILDRSKADTVARVITFAQVLWVLIQVIGRLAQRLPISILEITTVAYIFCATITYIAWWNKPLDIPVPHIVRATYPEREWPKRQTEFDAMVRLFISLSTKTGVVLFFILFTVFGGIHVTAWVYPFPTFAESLLWRICAVILTVSPFVLLLSGVALEAMPSSKTFDNIFASGAAVAYALIHLSIICEAFASLRSAPPGIYQQAAWTNFFPHF
jgi:hypothetical protein